MDSSPAGSSTGTFNCGVRDDGGVEIIGWFGGLLPFNTPKPSPLGVPSSYLLVHQFRLHTAWQLGDSAGRRRQGGCVRDWKLGETKSRHCLGRSELLRGIEESGCLRAFEIHQKPLSSPIITGALGLVPITPKGGNWSLVSRDVEIPRGPTPLLFFFFHSRAIVLLPFKASSMSVIRTHVAPYLLSISNPFCSLLSSNLSNSKRTVLAGGQGSPESLCLFFLSLGMTHGMFQVERLPSPRYLPDQTSEAHIPRPT